MENKKKVNVKKILYIVLLCVLGLVFVASLTFGSLAAFTTTVRDDLEVWFSSTFKKDIALLKTSIICLVVSAILLVITLSFKDFKKRFID